MSRIGSKLQTSTFDDPLVKYDDVDISYDGNPRSTSPYAFQMTFDNVRKEQESQPKDIPSIDAVMPKKIVPPYTDDGVV